MAGIFRNRWWVVVASVPGLIMGTGSINVFAFGVFLKPVTSDLGVDRGFFAAGLMVNTLLGSLFCPFVGMMMDRWGTRRMMIPGILLFAAATAAFALLGTSPFNVYLIFALAGITGIAQRPISYSAVISQWFDRQRGLALGVATAGVGLGVAIVPKIISFLITNFGWRLAYVGLGLTIVVVALVPVAIFLREPPYIDQGRNAAARASRAVDRQALPGARLGEALLDWRFWALVVAFFLAVTAINGTLTNIVALLTDRGFPVAVATTALSASGIAIVFGRIFSFSGWCLDRFFAPYVAIVFFAVPLAGIALLASGAGGMAPLLGAVLCGLGVGAEVDLTAFFVSRYFGPKAYNTIYVTMFALTLGTGGVGPWIAAKSFDLYRSHDPAFILLEVGLVLTCLLFPPLGSYPYPAQKRKPAGVVPPAGRPSQAVSSPPLR